MQNFNIYTCMLHQTIQPRAQIPEWLETFIAHAKLMIIRRTIERSVLQVFIISSRSRGDVHNTSQQKCNVAVHHPTSTFAFYNPSARQTASSHCTLKHTHTHTHKHCISASLERAPKCISNLSIAHVNHAHGAHHTKRTGHQNCTTHEPNRWMRRTDHLTNRRRNFAKASKKRHTRTYRNATKPSEKSTMIQLHFILERKREKGHTFTKTRSWDDAMRLRKRTSHSTSIPSVWCNM